MGFSKLEKDVLNISKLPNSVKGDAEQLKKTFDKAGEDIKEAHNKLVDELAEQNAASNIGAMSEEGATTVQAELDKLNDRIHVDFTELEIELDDELDVESENAVKNKVIAKEVNAVKGDLYAVDRYNIPVIENKVVSSGLQTINFLEDLEQVKMNECASAMLTVKSSSTYSTSEGHSLINAFDKSNTTYWYSANALSNYVEMRFKEPIKINKVKSRIDCGNTSYFKQARIVGSNDEITWTPLYTLTAIQSAVEELVLENTNHFSVYRIEYEVTTSVAVGLYHFEVVEWEGNYYNYCNILSIPLQKYDIGKKIQIKSGEMLLAEQNYVEESFSSNIIPILSSDAGVENKYGTWKAIQTEGYTSGGSPYLAFDGNDNTGWYNYKGSTVRYVGIESVETPDYKGFAIKPTYVRIYGGLYGRIDFQGRNENGEWETLRQFGNKTDSAVEAGASISANKFYTAFRLLYKPNSTSNHSYIYSFEITSGYIRYGVPFKKSKRIFDKPFLSINGMTPKRINARLFGDELYELIYNGENWEIVRNYVVGTYTGDEAPERFIYLGFKPKAVLIENALGLRSEAADGGLFLEDATIDTSPSGNPKAAWIVDNGFMIQRNSNTTLNYNHESYNPHRYIAFK